MTTRIPSAVAKAGEQADLLIAALSAGNTEPQQEAATSDAPVIEGELLSQEQSTEELSPDSGIDGQSITDEESAVNVITEQPTQDAAPQDGSVEYWKGQAESWEHKYSSLAGKYNTEIEQQKHHFFALKPEFDQLQVKNNELEETVQQLKSQLAEKPTEQPAKPESVFESPEMKERLGQIAEVYGDDLANGLRMLIETGVNSASASASTQINDLSEKVNTVESEVKTVKHDATVTTKEQESQAAHQARIDKLAQELSAIGVDFQKVDNDPSFHQWISKFDSETGMQRRNLMLSMLAGDEIKSVAGMYVQYIEQSGNAIQESIEPQKPAPQQQAPAQQVNLQEQVQVETKAPVVNEIPKPQPKWTSEAITKFYQDLATGHKYSPAEAERIEQEIFAQGMER